MIAFCLLLLCVFFKKGGGLNGICILMRKDAVHLILLVSLFSHAKFLGEGKERAL